jgi:hypothetical protein
LIGSRLESIDKSSRRRSASTELAQRADFRESPVAHDRTRRDLPHVCSFLDAQASEETHLDDLRLPCIEVRTALPFDSVDVEQADVHLVHDA